MTDTRFYSVSHTGDILKQMCDWCGTEDAIEEFKSAWLSHGRRMKVLNVDVYENSLMNVVHSEDKSGVTYGLGWLYSNLKGSDGEMLDYVGKTLEELRDGINIADAVGIVDMRRVKSKRTEHPMGDWILFCAYTSGYELVRSKVDFNTALKYDSYCSASDECQLNVDVALCFAILKSMMNSNINLNDACRSFEKFKEQASKVPTIQSFLGG